MAKRKDAWKEEDDRYLIETVLEYTSNGDTKTSAFKKASDVLGRTVSACAYRWNKELKDKLDEPSSKNLQPTEPPSPITVTATSDNDLVSITLEDVIEFLVHLKKNHELITVQEANEALQKENEDLHLQQSKLEKLFADKKKIYKELMEKYESVAHLLNEANQSIPNGGAIH